MIRTVTGRLPGATPPRVGGRVPIPASKSHTIRALLFAAFADGESRLRRPLYSRDAESCRAAVEALGATVTEDGKDWVVTGFGGRPRPRMTGKGPLRIDVGNSGTTLYLAAALAALSDIPVLFDGDSQIRRRSAAPLLAALEALGVRVESAPDGCAPFTVTGPLRTGSVEMDCPVSQYLSGLLMAAPLIRAGGARVGAGRAFTDTSTATAEVGAGRAFADISTPNAKVGAGRAFTETSTTSVPAVPAGGSPDGRRPTGAGAPGSTAPEVTQTIIRVKSLNEAPYAGMTLDWLNSQGIAWERDGWDEFRVPAGQAYRPFDRVVPADWSSATFFLAAAAVTGGSLVLEGLDTTDSQGDKDVLGMLETMGCVVEPVPGGVRIEGRPLTAAKLDLNATPDALPALAVTACFAEGTTRLVNVPQARMKETDRIMVMTTELLKLGADVEELKDGMLIRGKRPGGLGCEKPALKGAMVDGHHDHRVVMALALAGLGCCGQVSIRGAEAADVTFPGFFELLEQATIRN